MNFNWQWIVRCLVSALISGFGATALAAAVGAEFSPSEVRPGEHVEYVITVTSTESENVSPPQSISISGLRQVRGPDAQISQRSSMQIGNGGYEVKKEVIQQYVYLFIAEKKGNYSAGPFTIDIQGQETKVPVATLKVTDQPTSSGAGRGRGSGVQSPFGQAFPFGFDPTEDLSEAEEQLLNQLRGRLRQGRPGLPGGPGDEDNNALRGRKGPAPQFRTLPQNKDEAFFIQVEVDKTEVFEGEQVTVSWYVYTRGIMETFDRLKFPDLRGFWKEIIEEVPALNFSEEIVDGVPYRKALIASHALFPIKPGSATIDSFKVRSRVRMQSPFGLGFGRAFEFTKVSKPVPIKVLPLPIEDRPANFSGAVGDFEINAVADGTNFFANQPFTFKVRFEGKGNAKLIELPSIQWPDGLEMYDVKSEARFFKEGTSYKQFEVLVIPSKTGELILPEIEFSVFNPVTKKYISKKTPSQIIQVVENPNGNQVPFGSETATGGVAENGKSPKIKAPALPGPEIDTAQFAFIEQNWLMFLAISFFGCLAGLGMYARVQLGLGSRKRTLKLVLNQKWKEIQREFGKKHYQAMAAKVMSAYSMAVGELSRQSQGMPLDRLIELAPPSLRSEYGVQIRDNFDYFQTLCYAPKESLQELEGKQTVQQNLNEAQKLMKLMIDRSEELNV